MSQSPALLATSPSSIPRSISLPIRQPNSRAKPAFSQSHQACLVEAGGPSFGEDLPHRPHAASWFPQTSGRPGSAASGSSPVLNWSRDVQQQAPSSTTYGFQAAPARQEVPAPDARPSLRPGLLSRALSSTPAPPPKAVKSITREHDLFSGLRDTVVPKPSDQLPSWTLLPLKKLQEKHAVFTDSVVHMSYLLAERAHRGQLRKNGEPVLQHCLETAAILADLGLNSHIVAAGLLHDVLHDSTISKYELQEYLPSKVVELVEAVSRVSTLSQAYRNMGQQQHGGAAEDLLLAVTELGTGAVLVKLADRLHNMRTVAALPQHKRRAMAQETLDVYAVLANRLGLWSLKAELEDLSFKVLEPLHYAQVQQQVAQRQSQGFLQGSVDQLKTYLDQLGIEVEDISGRPKNLYGIYKKMVKDGLPLDQVYDVYAVRVVVKTKEQCYLVRDRVCALWQPLSVRSKDYIRHKKPNGYQSLHETVLGQDGLPFEVQIRTSKMHFIAEYGSSAHWQYKEGGAASSATAAMANKVKWMRWEAQCQHGLQDKKVRPVGSPQKDMSLSSLGWEYLGKADDKVDPLLLHKRVGLRKVAEDDLQLPVSVSLRRGGDAPERLYQLPAGSTIMDLLSSAVAGADLSGYRVQVNQQDSPGLNHVLTTGDDIHIQPDLASSTLSLFSLGVPFSQNVPLQPAAGVSTPRLMATAAAS